MKARRCMAAAPEAEALSSQKTHRVDIDFALDAACKFRRGCQPLAHVGRKVESARRLHQQSEAVPAADQRERRFRGPENSDFGGDRRNRHKAARMRLRRVLVCTRDDEAREPSEWRIAEALARFDLTR